MCVYTPLACYFVPMMDESRRKALTYYHQDLRSGILVKNILPAFAPYLTDVERLQVKGKGDSNNVGQVDELLEILRTKENRHFDGFCRVLDRHGYRDWAKRLQAAAGDCRGTDGRRAGWVKGPHTYIAIYFIPHHACLLVFTSCALYLRSMALYT